MLSDFLHLLYSLFIILFFGVLVIFLFPIIVVFLLVGAIIFLPLLILYLLFICFMSKGDRDDNNEDRGCSSGNDII